MASYYDGKDESLKLITLFRKEKKSQKLERRAYRQLFCQSCKILLLKYFFVFHSVKQLFAAIHKINKLCLNEIATFIRAFANGI